MNVSRLRSSTLLGISTLVLIVGSMPGLAMAATAPKSTATSSSNAVKNSANSLQISPVRSDVSIGQGQSSKVPVFVTNLTKNSVVLKAIENDFIAGDEKGTPSILLDDNQYAPTHSLKRFMLPLPNVTVAAGDTKEVDVTIQIPASAQPGGYFGALRFAPASIDGSQSVNLGASVGSLILMTVPGNYVEKMTLTNFDIQQNGGTGSNFRTPKDLSLFIRFRNQGSVQEAPFGQIQIKKGTTTVYTSKFNVNDPKDTILPDSARRWTLPLKGFGKFGKYTVSATFGYGEKGQSIDISKTVWIIPSAYIFGAIGGVILFILLIVGIIVGLKSYKRKILKSSRRRY